MSDIGDMSDDNKSSAALAEAIGHASASTWHMIRLVTAIVLLTGVLVVGAVIFSDEWRYAQQDYIEAVASWKACQEHINHGRLCGHIYGTMSKNPLMVALSATLHRMVGWMLPEAVSGVAVGLLTAMWTQALQNMFFRVCLVVAAVFLLSAFCRSRYGASAREQRLSEMYMRQLPMERDFVVTDSAVDLRQRKGASVQLLMGRGTG